MAKTKKTGGSAASGGSFKFSKASKARTKSEIYTEIANNTGLNRRQVASVFDAMCAMIGSDLKKGGPQMFTMPGLCKINVIRKPATKERQGINPFTKEMTTFKAKPARNVVKVRPLKGLKGMAT